MSKRVTLNDREIEVIIRELKESKDAGTAVRTNAWLGGEYINDLIEKLRPTNQEGGEENPVN